jgi:hypothetical protein
VVVVVAPFVCSVWVDAAKRDEQEQRTDFCRLLIVFVFSVVDRT